MNIDLTDQELATIQACLSVSRVQAQERAARWPGSVWPALVKKYGRLMDKIDRVRDQRLRDREKAKDKKEIPILAVKPKVKPLTYTRV